MSRRLTSLRSNRRIAPRLPALGFLLLAGACALEQPLQERAVGRFGQFSLYQASAGMKRVIIGAPHGITEPVKVAQSRLELPRIEVQLMPCGRIESTPSRTGVPGIVIAAPHGSFDEYTAEMVEQISYRTGIAAIVAKGFTPTECAGWRINVNRPTESRYPLGEIQINSARAERTYRVFKDAVMQASNGDLKLYIDIHQNGRQQNIEVATVGVTEKEARLIKNAYRALRDRVLGLSSAIHTADLLIEPIDAVEIGAWAAKAEGILTVAEKSLHFEFPLYATLSSAKARQAYTDILTSLLEQTTPFLVAQPPYRRRVSDASSN